MRAVVQRVSTAEVKIDGNSVGKIDKGFLSFTWSNTYRHSKRC